MAQESKYPKKIPAPDNTAIELVQRESRMVRLPSGMMAQFVKMDIQVPPDLVYSIGKDASGKERGGFLASLYSIVSREMGISYTNTEILEKTDDTIRLQVWDKFMSSKGIVVEDNTIIELSARKLYEESRLKWMPMAWKEFPKDNGQGTYKKQIFDEVKFEELQKQGFMKDEVLYDEKTGVPTGIKRKLPPDKERELYLNHLTLQKNLLSKADTVAHRKLTQRACGYNGIKMPDQSKEGWEKELKLSIYAFISSTGEVLNPDDVNLEEHDDLNEDEIEEPAKSQTVNKTEQPKTQQQEKKTEKAAEATKTVAEDKKTPPAENKTEKP